MTKEEVELVANLLAEDDGFPTVGRSGRSVTEMVLERYRERAMRILVMIEVHRNDNASPQRKRARALGG